MSVGYLIDKPTIDGRAGTLAIQIRDVFDQIATFSTFLGENTDAQLMAYGYTQPDVTLLRSSFTDLQNLHLVATGQSTQAVANNFFFHSSSLTGVN